MLCTTFVQSVARPADDVLGGDQVAVEVALCFVSPDHGILLQQYQALDATGWSMVTGHKVG